MPSQWRRTSLYHSSIYVCDCALTNRFDAWFWRRGELLLSLLMCAVSRWIAPYSHPPPTSHAPPPPRATLPPPQIPVWQIGWFWQAAFTWSRSAIRPPRLRDVSAIWYKQDASHYKYFTEVCHGWANFLVSCKTPYVTVVIYERSHS